MQPKVLETETKPRKKYPEVDIGSIFNTMLTKAPEYTLLLAGLWPTSGANAPVGGEFCTESRFGVIFSSRNCIGIGFCESKGAGALQVASTSGNVSVIADAITLHLLHGSSGRLAAIDLRRIEKSLQQMNGNALLQTDKSAGRRILEVIVMQE